MSEPEKRILSSSNGAIVPGWPRDEEGHWKVPKGYFLTLAQTLEDCQYGLGHVPNLPDLPPEQPK